MKALTKTHLLRRLLRRNISVKQLAGYALANLVGLAIMMTALQFYRDATAPTADSDDSLLGTDYMVISKEVSDAGRFLGNSTSFSEAEIADLESRPWVDAVGQFTPARFNVNAYVDFGGRSMSTYLFFESIPDEFFDTLPEGWKFDPSNPSAEIPIIISKDYLALYNFGFAASRGMPQISESMVKKVPLQVAVSGQGSQRWFPARVVGFSSRLNTIAVPEEFMQWANAAYGDEHKANEEVSRLIVKVNDPGNPDIDRYLANNAIEVAGDNAGRSRAAYLMSIIALVVGIIGIVISSLSFFILMLSIYLLLQKNAATIHQLLMLGYSTRATARQYALMVVFINSSIFILASVLTITMSTLWRKPLSSLGIATTSPWLTIAIALALVAVVTAINLRAIYRTVARNFYQ